MHTSHLAITVSNDVKLSNFVLIKLYGERIRDKTTILFFSPSLFFPKA